MSTPTEEQFGLSLRLHVLSSIFSWCRLMAITMSPLDVRSRLLLTCRQSVDQIVRQTKNV